MSEEHTPIAELMARAPALLGDADLDRIIAELRSQRQRFVMTNDTSIGKPEPRKSAAQKKRESDIAGADLSIDDILSGI